MLVRTLLLILVLAMLSLCVTAQIKPSRSVFNEPLDVKEEPGVAAGGWFAAEAFRGWASYLDEQAWQFRLHGYIEPYRFGDDSVANFTTSLQFHHELTANPHNDLGFNPRTARWEEMLLLHARVAPFTIQTGWFHRCKHEIDNTEAPDENNVEPYDPTRRVLIVSGPTLIGVSPAVQTPLGEFRVQAGGEWYVVHEDYRTPDTSITGTWNDLLASVWLRGEARWVLAERTRLSGSYYISFPFSRSRNGAPDDIVVPHEAHAEVVLSFLSKRGALSIVVAADHTWDEVAFLTANPTTVVQAGLRVGL